MIQAYLDKAVACSKSYTREGKTASYIPELAKANMDHVGVCVIKTDGTMYSSGDCDQYFTIQSISKIMTLAIALQNHRYQEIFEKVKMEPRKPLSTLCILAVIGIILIVVVSFFTILYL